MKQTRETPWDAVLFDLDGTLTDSAPGITNSVAHSLAQYGIQADPKDLTVFVGPPLAESFQKYYGIQDTDEAIRRYREYYTTKGMFENAVYEGMEELLKDLKEKGVKLYVCTSKPEDYAKIIIDHFGLAPYFDGVFGASMDEKRVEKADVMAYAFEHAHPQHPIMVGDRLHDVQGAHANGLECIGVLYGYGSRNELEEAGAEFITPDVQSLHQLLKENTVCDSAK